jgi:homoserine O-acetyltransferase
MFRVASAARPLVSAQLGHSIAAGNAIQAPFGTATSASHRSSQWAQTDGVPPMATGTIRSSPPFLLASGMELPADSMQVKYATWGDPSNPAILICPSMSQSAFAADMPDEQDKSKVKSGWWRQVVGAGDHFGIDTRKFYVISGAPLGSPFGSTSPLTTNPETGEAFGPHFPQITPADMAATQALLLDHLMVDKVLAVVGGSMGAMQALQFATMFPDR